MQGSPLASYPGSCGYEARQPISQTYKQLTNMLQKACIYSFLKQLFGCELFSQKTGVEALDARPLNNVRGLF